MIKPLELLVGLRYTRAKRRNHFISFISLFSILGLALSLIVLITVMSVMNGFQKELRERILGMTAHATIRGDYGRMPNWREVATLAAQHPDVIGVAPYIQAEGMLSHGQQVHPTLIRGILPAEEPKVSEVGDKMIIGQLEDLRPGEFGIILGAELARALGVMQGDKITLIIPQTSVTPTGIMPRLKRFTVKGIFQVDHQDYDSGLAFLHADDAARLFRMPGQVSGVRLKLNDMFKSWQVTQDLVNQLQGDYWISDWTRQHANFFRAVKMEKMVMFFILSMLIGIAAFNLVSTMVMTVVDKEADIAIMRTLGATPGMILRIFMVQGTIIGLVGITMGVVGGVALASNVEVIVPAIEQALGMKFLSADVYYISELPSELQWADVIWVSIVGFLSCLIATIYPAMRASRVQPAEVLRYE